MERTIGNRDGVRLSDRMRLVAAVGALALVGLMLVSGLSAGAGANFTSRVADAPMTSHLAPAATNTPWTYPTTTMEEPGWTGGKYVMASTVDIEHLNLYGSTDVYSAMVFNEIYDTLDAYTPNQTYIPWAASGWSEAAAPAGMTYMDQLTGQLTNVSWIYTVNIRPGIQWSDWTTADSGSTYTYSNHSVWSLDNAYTGYTEKTFSYTYSWPSVQMATEQIQSADLILSWEILATSLDYSGNWASVVGIIPESNLTAEFLLSAQSATFVTYTLNDPILPYHSWVSHDWADTATSAWNYTGAGYPNGYDSWDVGYNPSTGYASDLIGSGPFMFTNSYGQPEGQWVPDSYWDLFANPHYFVQYVPSLEMWTPKIAEIYVPLYLSESAAVSAQVLGEADTQLQASGNDPSFLPTLKTIPDTTIFYQPTGNFDYMGLNPAASNAPFNVTAFRQALNYASNKAYLAAVLGEGYVTLGQPIVPVADSVWHNSSAPQYTYSLTTAASLLAGIPGMTKNGAGNLVYLGNPVTITLQITPASISPLAVEGAYIVAQAWTSLGIPTSVTQEAFATLDANLVSNHYQVVDLGITGIEGDPTGDYFLFYNSTDGTGTGFYEGPYSSLTWDGQALTGPQVSSLMNNLTNELNVQTDFTTRLAISDEIQGIAAEESTIINLGYPIAILPFSNSTFTGLIEDSLAYTTFMYWNFLSFHLKSSSTAAPPAKIPTELKVGVVTDQTVYTNGQYGNVTVQVRNQYGEPEAGMNVSIGFRPSGQLINLTADQGTTNAQGQYVWEFQVFPSNPQIFSSDYAGIINISASATGPAGTAPGTVIGGVGWTDIDVAPLPVAYSAGSVPSLVVGDSAVPYSIKVYNPSTGAPIAGYSYTIQALSGAVVMTSGETGQSVTQTTSYNPVFPYLGLPFVGYQSVTVSNQSDYNVTSITGVTGSNGLITVDLAANASANFSAMGSSFGSWVFLGNYAAGGSLTGAPPYAVISELTSSFDPTGFGQQEPVEFPLTVTDVPMAVDLAISVAGGPLGPSGTLSVTVAATNSTTGDPVPGYTFTLESQNALGANRGVFSNPSGTPVEAYTPNEFFGSTFLPGLTLTTNASGEASATFSPELYTPASIGGLFSGFDSMSYTDPNLIPFDEFELSAVGAGAATVATTANSSAMVYNPPVTAAASAYFGGAGSLDGFTVLDGNATYPVYVNTTQSSPWGPAIGSVPLNVSVSLGTIGTASGTTSSSGSFATTYAAPNVTVLTAVTISITYETQGANETVTETIYLSPAAPAAKTTTPKSSSSTNTTLDDELYAVAGILGVLMVIFLALWLTGRKPAPSPPTVQPWSSTATTSSTGPGGEAPKGDPSSATPPASPPSGT